jgi:hypothetical protein
MPRYFRRKIVGGEINGPCGKRKLRQVTSGLTDRMVAGN